VDGDSSRHSDTGNGRERGHGLASDATERPTGVGEDRLTDLERRSSSASRPEQDRQQLGAAEDACTEVDEPLTRPL